MGASLAGEGLIRSTLPDERWRPLVDSFGYSLGFLIVILGRERADGEARQVVMAGRVHAGHFEDAIGVAGEKRAPRRGASGGQRPVVAAAAAASAAGGCSNA